MKLTYKQWLAAPVLVIGLVLAPAALAQSDDQDSCSKQPCAPVVNNEEGKDANLQAANQDPDASQSQARSPQTGYLNTNYAVPLNGGAPISVDAPRHLHLLYALSTSQGYDTNVAGPFSNISSYTSVYEGYGGALWRFTNGYILLQHDTAFTYFGSSLLQGSGFHQTSVIAGTALTSNVGLLLEASSSEGNNTLTEVIPPTVVIVNGVAVIAPANAAAGLNLGFVWGSDLVGTINWKPDQHDIFSFRAENANHQFYGLDAHDNLETFKLTYQRQLSENTTLGAYGITRHQTGDIFCDSYGFGLLAATKPTARIFLQAEVGPDFDSTGCFRHQGFELHFAGTYLLTRTTTLYALVDRQQSSGFIPSSTWQDDASAGLAKQLNRRLWWSIGAGYERGFIIPSLNEYHGIYAQTQFRQRLSNSFTLEGLYRRLDQSITGLGLHRNIVLVTLRWSPRNHDPGRTAMYQSTNDYRSGHEE